MNSFLQLVDALCVESQVRETGIAFSKALEAQRQGILTGHQVALMEVAVNRGLALPTWLCQALSMVEAKP
jgi:hypothetical protein